VDKDILNLLKERNTNSCELMQILYFVLCKEVVLERAEVLDKSCVH